MDSLKFAFDTVIIGALALPWLWLFMRIFFQRSSNGEDPKFPMLSALSDSTRQMVSGVLILALGYFLGSAVSRISSDFFDDAEILQGMPTRNSIRQGVYLHEYCDEHSVLVATKLPAELVGAGGRAAFCNEANLEELVTEFFSLQESKLLLVGEDKLARLRQFHDQIEILRGATLNGVIFFTLSWFGLCALYRAGAPTGKLRILRKCASYVPPLFFLLLGLWTMEQHFSRLWPAISGVTCDPASLGPGAVSNCSVTLRHEAPARGSTVTLASRNPLITVPASVTVAAGTTKATFSATAATTISGNPAATVTASLDKSSQAVTITLYEQAGTAPSHTISPTFNAYEGHRDPPLAEAVIVLLGIGGLCLRLTDDSPRLFRNVCLMAAVLTVIAYGSWWWTEVLYDEQVIHSIPTNLQGSQDLRGDRSHFSERFERESRAIAAALNHPNIDFLEKI
jgi:hypothetical protein